MFWGAIEFGVDAALVWFGARLRHAQVKEVKKPFKEKLRALKGFFSLLPVSAESVNRLNAASKIALELSETRTTIVHGVCHGTTIYGSLSFMRSDFRRSGHLGVFREIGLDELDQSVEQLIECEREFRRIFDAAMRDCEGVKIG